GPDHHVSDAGPDHHVSDAGPDHHVSDAGPDHHVSDAGPDHHVSDAGPHHHVSDAGPDHHVSDAGPDHHVSDAGPDHHVSDAGPDHHVSDAGPDHHVSDAGPDHHVSDAGPDHHVSDAGSTDDNTCGSRSDNPTIVNSANHTVSDTRSSESCDTTVGSPESCDTTVGSPESCDTTVGSPESCDTTVGGPESRDRTVGEQLEEELRRQVGRLQTELDEARLDIQRHQDKCLQLLAELQWVQEELERVEEEKECELLEVQERLHSAREEVVNLRHGAEEAGAERENEIATLQEELCRVQAHLQRLQQISAGYELEITSLRGEISLKTQSQQRRGAEEVAQLQGAVQSLQSECRKLRDENKDLTERLEDMEQLNIRVAERGGEAPQKVVCWSPYLTTGTKPAHGPRSDPGPAPGAASVRTASEADSPEYCDKVTPSVRGPYRLSAGRETVRGRAGGGCGQGEVNLTQLESCLREMEEQSTECGHSRRLSQRDSGSLEDSSLREQLCEAEQRAMCVQRECQGLLRELKTLEERYQRSQAERMELETELSQCKDQIHRLETVNPQG
uniref:Stress response protein NST1-like n=1 Tax=Callorhinchus milii TaxID=7868 RepID=A0A4W3IXS9_CALMI